MKRVWVRGAVAATALVALASASVASAQTAPSNYLKCDGQPNNVTAGETAARLLGAVTLLALLAPPPESPNASARLRGEQGVEACTALIDGEKKEGNPERRVTLILGRALHHIEAKQYDAALSDVAMAREEAKAAGLTANAYFMVTRGTAFDNIEAAALFRKGDARAAQMASLRSVESVRFALMPMIRATQFSAWNRTPVPGYDAHLAGLARIYPLMTFSYAAWLEDMGRFKESADIREQMISLYTSNGSTFQLPLTLAQTGLIQALAGNWELAAKRIGEARNAYDKRVEAGKSGTSDAAYIEVVDLYKLLLKAHEGDMATARRLFAGRSEWVNSSFGAVMEINRRLRAGAKPDELIGAFEKTPEQMWEARQKRIEAQRLARDDDNRTLWSLIPPYFSAKTFEAASKQVWETGNSKILRKSKSRPDPSTARMELLFYPGWTLSVAQPAYMLHAALLAKSRGHNGFVIQPLMLSRAFLVQIRTGNKGDPGMEEAYFLPAQDVIDALSPLIPSPATLKSRA